MKEVGVDLTLCHVVLMLLGVNIKPKKQTKRESYQLLLFHNTKVLLLKLVKESE